MLTYLQKAQIVKNIDHTNYRLWSSLLNSPLKYKHDSSAVLRLLSCFIDEISSYSYNSNFLQTFNHERFQYNNLSRFKKYLLSI
jgi:hypothetical protein